MNKTDRLSPAWHPDELDFLRRHRILGADALPQDLTRVKERWIYNTLREVFLTTNGYVLKRYSHFPGRKDYRKVWKREHDALCRLSGLSAPDSMGYIGVNHGAGIAGILHLRTLVPGSPAIWRSEDDLKNLADLMVGIHQRHVVTLDPQQENFIYTGNHEHPIGFIDFGRARVFRTMSPLMLINMGKDLAKLEIEGGLSHQQFSVFSQHYQDRIQFNPAQKTVVQLSVRYWQNRHARKQQRNKN